MTQLQGSLVPLEAKGEDCPRMQGLALKNVRVKVVNQKKRWPTRGLASCCSPTLACPAPSF